MSTDIDYNKLVEESRKLAFSPTNLNDIHKYFPIEYTEECRKKICERGAALEEIDRLILQKNAQRANLESINTVSITTQLGDASDAIQEYQNTKDYILGKIADIDTKIEALRTKILEINKWIRVKLAQFDVIHKTTSRADIVRLADEIETYYKKINQLNASINVNNNMIDVLSKTRGPFGQPLVGERALQPYRQRIVQDTLERETTQQKLDQARENLIAILDTFTNA